MRHRLQHFALRAVLGLALLLAGPAQLLAQMEETTPGGMSAYRNVFIAYAVVWLLVGGWILSIARRMTALSRRLDG